MLADEETTRVDTGLLSLALVVAVVASLWVALRTGWSIELIALLAILALLVARQVIARQRRIGHELQELVVSERAVSTTLEHRVQERTAELADAQRVLQRMWTLGHHITLELDPARVVQRFMEAVVDVAQADGIALGLGNPSGGVRISAASGIAASFQDESLGAESAMGRVMRAGRAWFAEDIARDPRGVSLAIRLTSPEIGARSIAVIPVARSGSAIGALALITRKPRAWSSDELSRVEALTDLLSVALANAELVEGLRKAEWRFRTLFRAAPDAVFTVLQSGRVREANDFVREVVGTDPRQVIGCQFLDLVIEEDRGAMETALDRAFSGSPARLEVRFLHAVPAVPDETGKPSPSTHLVAIAASRVPEAEPPTVLVIGRDISDEREMRARLLETERLAAVGELVAGVAHEVNNPLSSISAYAQLLLRDSALSPSQRESMEIIRSETSRASQVVKDLLAFARRSTPERQPLDLNQVIERSLRLRAYQLSTSNIDVERSLPNDLPAVVGDARQLQQVVLNLVTNAIQAMATGGRGALHVETSASGGQVHLDVTDTGPGITASARPHIFEPFFTTKREGEGTGLGLSVSYGIIAALGGRIELADTGPSGSRFRVTLPAAPAEAAIPEPGVSAPVEEDAFRKTPATGEWAPTTARSALAGLRLLVVDDEVSLRRGIEAFGRMRGFDVVTADEGQSALELVRATSFDAVVCDLRMPGMDGVAFHEALRAEWPGLAARTIFITGDTMGSVGRSSPAARQPMLSKPFTFELL